MKWVIRISVRGKGADRPWVRQESGHSLYPWRGYTGTAKEIRRIVYSWERYFGLEMRERWSVKR
jgi:hypothetical protein